ncbi:hypothetical protein A2276_03235 [candidate division WOR-1 bacterium RIFOXYA12_FULL_43_27]|uniref:Glycerol-3-phosphate dehydrogenase [NAD(P)+] n=1 Tax=candidate division WOR-1 bacterium RIFOXYC2_FULL_46_14 TaxID=1802587 RepID=A0A1F4U7D5_UNCSA|nr:MAG: hypothetical protein A2276_03235 [candidate division WOR-1 bacterium RIFOXYA12_FULL_43_27]OGC19284.1 MAG: hypothetical protein A2292_01100 [candidate division WOR-1 bacterium RIFOXYB2_FULL_46_45]OGC30273.1 MAG: hypothetical protein A2232_01100 [candidate division WOR-1 bacterium RIFOXYA2_FULL_46_56]OGC40874.1 MAG: hypothetical protein A2438_01100 [candidate division WOR-1 bacterium RIFOXYC2_FULL_46_14]
MPSKIAVIGAGAWGTSLATLFAENGHTVTLWAYEEFDFPLPRSVEVVSDLQTACLDKELIVFVVPTQFTRQTIKKIKTIPQKTLLLSASKGIEIDSLKRPSQIIGEHFNRKVAVLSGPNLAVEIAQGLPAATVVTSKVIQRLLNSQRFRVYTGNDVIGVELGGALKNIIAIAAGICDGLKLGENARAALLIRGISEITRLGKKLGAKENTFYGLSGMGDLILTCGSSKSRNHEVGRRISGGEKMEEIVKSMSQVAEGIPTSKAVYKLARKLKLEMPISSGVYSVLYEGAEPFAIISELLKRKPKAED